MLFTNADMQQLQTLLSMHVLSVPHTFFLAPQPWERQRPQTEVGIPEAVTTRGGRRANYYPWMDAVCAQ